MTWGLVLSGGVAQGIANVGVLRVLEREGLAPDYVGGSSMGAVAGALLALGYSSDVFDGILKDVSPFTVAEPSGNPLKDGFHGGFLQQKLHRFLGDLLGDKRVGDCSIPFLCLAGKVIRPIRWEKMFSPDFAQDVRTCVEPYFFPHDARIIDALMATSAVPVVFSPVTVGEDSFIDLCSFGAVPARTLRQVYLPDIVIATDTQPHYERLAPFLPKGWKQFLADGARSLQESLDSCDLVIKPDLPYGPYRFDKADAFVKAGEEAAERMLPKIRTLLS